MNNAKVQTFSAILNKICSIKMAQNHPYHLDAEENLLNLAIRVVPADGPAPLAWVSGS